MDMRTRRELLKDRARNLLSFGSLAVLLAATAWVGWQSLEAQRRQEKPPGDVQIRLSDTGFQVFTVRDGRHLLVAEVRASSVSVTQDRTRVTLEDVREITIFRDEEPYLKGQTKQARYDQVVKRLEIPGELAMAAVDGSIKFKARGVNYYGESEQVVCTQPVTADFRGGVLKTSTMSISVRDEMLECRNTVTFERPKGGRIVADSALASLKQKTVALSGNVQLSMTVKEIQETAQLRARAAGREQTRVRLQTTQVTFDIATKDVLCPEPVTVSTKDGQLSSNEARVEGDRITLQGNVQATIQLRDAEGPLKMRTDVVEYNVQTDEFVVPKPVDIETVAGKFRATRATANPSQGKVSLEGGVSGSFTL